MQAPTVRYIALVLPLLWAPVTFSAAGLPPMGFYNPSDRGGSLLTSVPVTYPMGQGEPVNLVISGASDPRVLQDQRDNGGLQSYFLSMGFSGECLGQHAGSHQAVDLGDGNGPRNETGVMRWNYGDPSLGTCKESVDGGNHFRYWIQGGSNANSGAIFMAVSYEKPSSGLYSFLGCEEIFPNLGHRMVEQHDIVTNGYNRGRDWLIGNITQSEILNSQLQNGSNFTGTTARDRYTYHTEIQYISGILPNTSYGINHNATVGEEGINACDGLLAVLNVRLLDTPQQTSGTPKMYTRRIYTSMMWPAVAVFSSLYGFSAQ